MLKTLWVSPSVKPKPSMLYTVCSHQNTMMQHFHFTKPNTQSQAITQPSVLSHQSNTIFLRFSQTIIDYVVYTRLIQLGNHKHVVDVVHTVFLVVITIRPQKKLIVIMTKTPHTQRSMREKHQSFVTNAS
jgi:hypothetical protein